MNKYLITITYNSGYVKIIRTSDSEDESKDIMERIQFISTDTNIRSINVYKMVDSVPFIDPIENLMKDGGLL